MSVPSGNFGNLTAGLMAKKMGLGVHNFIAANNANHPVVDYLINGRFNPGPTRHTITNAMDVGNPSNFRRILELFNNNHDEISAAVKGYWFTDEQTLRAIKDLDSKYGYQADPHGAIAYLGLQKFMEGHECQGIFLETAHPAKFQYEPVTDKKDEKMIPETLKDLLLLEKRSIKIPASFDYLKNFLMDHCR
jgi:threonine synthase